MSEIEPAPFRETRETEVVALSAPMISRAVEVHMEAFAGYMNVLLGRTYVHAFLSWFVSDQEAIALGATIGADLAGYVVGAPADYQRRLNRDLAPLVAQIFILRPWLFFRPNLRRAVIARIRSLALRNSGRPTPRMATPGEVSPSQIVSLVGIGVSSAARGQGAGKFLLRHFEAKAREAGMQSMRLSVYRTNSSARGLYERMGWVAVPALTDSASMEYEKPLRNPALDE